MKPRGFVATVDIENCLNDTWKKTCEVVSTLDCKIGRLGLYYTYQSYFLPQEK